MVCYLSLINRDILQRHRHWKDTPWLSLDVEDVRKKLAGESQRLRELGTRVQKWQLLNDLLSNITSIQVQFDTSSLAFESSLLNSVGHTLL